jgi:phage terminase large subunit-like protein
VSSTSGSAGGTGKARRRTKSNIEIAGELKANNVALFFDKCLTHVKGELSGRPLTLSDWQFNDIIKPLFGTLNDDGTRRFRTAYIEIPRKNGKSTLAAGIALFLLLADGEQGAEIVSAAADREQASIVFDIASSMIQANPLLSQRCTVMRKEIVTKNGSRYRAISADAFTKHGMNCSGIIFDELHAQPNRELWDVLTTSTGARVQPLTISITTAGHDRNSLCYEMHTKARGVLDGSIKDGSFLPVLYRAPDGSDWRKEETWRIANPGYGVSVRAEYFHQAAADAASSPARELAFRRLHLCEWTDTITRWLNLDNWDACRAARPDLTGRPCYGALDLSSTVDLSAFVLAFPMDDGTIWIEPYCWAPRGVLKLRERSNKMRYDQWYASSHLRLTDGDVIEYDEVYGHIKTLAQQYRIIDVAIDRWNCAQLAQQMQSDGIQVFGFGQGYASMSPAAKDFETLITAKKIRHDGHPVLRWCIGNCSIESDAAGNIKPSKSKSSEKIDALIASVMAVARSRVGEAGGIKGIGAPSIYEQRGMVTL